jgi:multiple sugar transport system ATP-binding protein
VESLGNEQLLTCRLLEGDQLVQLRADPEQRVAPGETVHLEVEASGWRLFDNGGEALPAAPPPAAPSPEPLLPPLG